MAIKKHPLPPGDVKKIILDTNPRHVGDTSDRISPIALLSLVSQAGLTEDPEVQKKLEQLGVFPTSKR
jgi:hypothetical protein